MPALCASIGAPGLHQVARPVDRRLEDEDGGRRWPRGRNPNADALLEGPRSGFGGRGIRRVGERAPRRARGRLEGRLGRFREGSSSSRADRRTREVGPGRVPVLGTETETGRADSESLRPVEGATARCHRPCCPSWLLLGKIGAPPKASQSLAERRRSGVLTLVLRCPTTHQGYQRATLGAHLPLRPPGHVKEFFRAHTLPTQHPLCG
jgi:hypothetical protein